jgi:hypothetical protein
MVAVVAAALRAVLMRADRLLSLRGVYCYAAAAVVAVLLFIIITSSIINTTKAGAMPKRNKSTNTSTSILALRRMVVVVVPVVVARMAVGVRVGSHRLRFWIARRASKMPAFIFADVSLEHLERAQMNDSIFGVVVKIVM